MKSPRTRQQLWNYSGKNPFLFSISSYTRFLFHAVYNVPGMGKNYLRARQHRDLISILPDGTRLYEFHPWEKNITRNISTHIGQDVPIPDYLIRLEAAGEDVSDYETIWYYF